MSKLSFRARALDATKPMPIFRTEEVPDLPDFAAINRAVPQMPTGMEKEEECEHHLQRAMSAQQAFGHTVEHVIPTPEVFEASDKEYDELYPPNYKIPRQLIHMQLLTIEQDIPDYDMDSEDEAWLNQQSIELTPIKFEEMMDRLERSSGQQVVQLKEAKLLLKEDDDLIIAVYDYWLNKRLKIQQPLIPVVKIEKRDGSTTNNPYVAFRRRIEKMQTRKNRKNDETSYEKMLKLRRDLSRAVNLLDLIKHREKTKHDHLKLCVDIFEKRYQMGDFSGQILNEVSALRHIRPTSYLPINNVQLLSRLERGVGRPRNDEYSIHTKRKREYKKRRADSNIRIDQNEHNDYLFSSDDEGILAADQLSDQDEIEDDPDGYYAFRRKRGCNYHAPLTERLGNWPWCSPEEGGLADKRYRFCLTSISRPNRCIGFSRRRVGRGGRIIFDRAFTPFDDHWSELNELTRTIIPNGFSPPHSEFINEIKNEWLHFKPQTPHQEITNSYSSNDNEETVEYDEDGNIIPVVSITSLKEYIEDGLVCDGNAELDYATFQSHQEELFEMHRRQLERLKSDENDSVSKSCNNLCNSEHSSKIISCSSPVSSTNTSTTSTSTPPSPTSSSSQQISTLDSAKAQFAVSTVLSASEFTNILKSDCAKDIMILGGINVV